MRQAVRLICSTLFMTASINSYAQGDMVNYTLDAKEPIVGCKIVALKNGEDVGKIESITGSKLNLRINRENVYKITINEKSVYYLQYESQSGFAQVDGVKVTNPNGSSTMAATSSDVLEQDLGMKFRIQLGAFANDISISPFQNAGPLYTEKTDGGITRYMVGSYATHGEAAEAELKLRDMGFVGAFAVVCMDGKRISFNEAQQWSAQNTK